MNIETRVVPLEGVQGEIKEYTLRGDDISISFLNLGCAITEISIPDSQGTLSNIVLAYEDYTDYINNNSYQGCIAGRFAGRIGNATFNIEGKEYRLAKNDGNNSLHGGRNGLNKKVWNAEVYESNDRIGVKFTYTSPDGEEGFPGCVDFLVDYSLHNDNSFNITMTGSSDQDTLINLTNHTYYNLSNLEDTILNHNIYIDSRGFCELGNDLIPTGRIITDGTFDFRSPHTLGEEVAKKSEHLAGGGLDHPFVLNESGSAWISYPGTGRSMKISSNQPVAVVYTSNMMGDDISFKDGKRGRPFLGICMEMQDFPDHINQDNFLSNLYGKSREYRNEIRLEFNIL